MDDALQIILGYVREVLRRQALVTTVALVLCCIGWIVVFRLPDMYLAQTQIYIDARSFLDELLSGLAVDEDGGNRELIELARAGLTNRASLDKIVREADLGLNSVTPAEHDSLLESISSRIQVETRGGRYPNQLIISFTDPDPNVSQIAITTLLNTLIETSMGVEQVDTRRSEEFVERQIEEYEQRLSEAEQNLSAFKREHIGLLPGEGRTYFSELQQARDNVNNARLELGEAENRRDRLKAQFDALRDPNSPARPRLNNQRVLALQAVLDELLLQYTENHPEVISTREQLVRLTDPNRAFSTEDLIGQNGDMGDRLVTAEFMVALSQVDADVASAELRLREFERRRDTLEASITIMPEVEAQLQKLTRNYDIYRAQYDQLVERRESARLSREAGMNRDDSQFRIIEPPHTTATPVSPNRLLLNTAVFVAAWGVALGAAVLLSEISPTLSTIGEITKFTNLPVIGTISVTSEREFMAFEKVKFLAIGIGSSLGLYSTVLVLSFI